MFHDDTHHAVDLIVYVLLLLSGVGRVVEGVVLRQLGLLGIGGHLGSIVLPLALILQLVPDVGCNFEDLLVVDKDGDFTLAVAQLLPLHFHFFAGSQCLRKGFVLDQDVRALCWQLVAFDLHIADISEAREDGGEVLFVGVLRIIANRGIQHGYEVVLDFVEGIVADHVGSLEVICKEYLEVGIVVVLVEGGVDVVVVCTGVGGVLHLEVLHEHEVLYDLHVLDLAVLAEEAADGLVARVVHPTHIQLPNQDALVDLLGRLRLLGQLRPLALPQLHVHFVNGQLVVDRVVADGQSDFLLSLLHLGLLVVFVAGAGA